MTPNEGFNVRAVEKETLPQPIADAVTKLEVAFPDNYFHDMEITPHTIEGRGDFVVVRVKNWAGSTGRSYDRSDFFIVTPTGKIFAVGAEGEIGAHGARDERGIVVDNNEKLVNTDESEPLSIFRALMRGSEIRLVWNHRYLKGKPDLVSISFMGEYPEMESDMPEITAEEARQILEQRKANKQGEEES